MNKDSEIGKRVKDVRESKELTQAEFAESIKVGQSTLAMFERGQRTLKEIHIEQICSKYNISKEWLLYGKGEMHNRIDDFTEISAIIDERDPKARQAIIDYWNLSDEDKEIFWKFIKRFIGKERD